MENNKIIEKLKESDNLPCIIVTKEGKHFLASPQELGEDSLRYGVYDETALGFLKSDDWTMASINSDYIMFSDIFSVISWNDLKNYIGWIKTWEDHNKKAMKQ